MSKKRGSQGRRLAGWAVMLAAVSALSGCGRLMAVVHGGPDRPAASEFGLGPRTTSTGLYRVVLEPVEPLATRRLQKVHVRVVDTADRPVDGAEMTVDGGMPQHGHGLPTRPRMTGGLGDGRYEIDGVRFNMGGWWEFKLAISAAAGTDSVTFNLDL
ncbi:FixH family protein [soil metagenome]